MKARVTVTLKSGVLDPQGKAIEGALRSLGIEGVASVRQGKVFDVELDTADKAGAEETLKAACEKLLANTVVENFRVEIASLSDRRGGTERRSRRDSARRAAPRQVDEET
jgi:phosphoribosylformylglycinamidine synthase